MIKKNSLAKFFALPVELMGLRNLLAVHFFINSIGLIVFAILVARILGKFVQPSVYVYASFYPWARPPVGAVDKLTSLLEYILPVLALLFYSAIFLRISKFFSSLNITIETDRLKKIGFYFLTGAVINGLLLVVDKEQKFRLAALSLLWVFLFLLAPLSVYRNRPLTISIPSWVWGVVLCAIAAQYAAIFVPLIINPMRIENDYINIPEKTILKSGDVVDNIDYINEHKIAGLQLYDPRNVQNKEALTKVSANVMLHLDKLHIQEKVYSEEELDFIKRNSIELLNQTKAGWFFYHHVYSFGPMNAMSLGASSYDQAMVYGWLSTVMQSKVLKLLGMSSYQGYFKVYFAAYLAYFAIFLLGIWAIFRRLETVVFAAILSVSALFLLGFELIRLAPGFNPLRHIFDVPVFYLLYRYLAQDRKGYLIFACILALFSILWNKDFGLFLALSVGGAVLFKGLKQRPFALVPLLVGSVTVIAAALLFFSPMPGANPTAGYMMLGVGTPQATNGEIFGLLLIVSLLLAATIRIKQNEAYTILAVGAALYFVQSLTYYIWYPFAHHLLGVAPVFILWLVVLFHGWTSQFQDGVIPKRGGGVLLLLLLFIYLPASARFYFGQWTYNKIFKEHRLFHWSFKEASFISTMDPALFEESVNMINRYSSNDNGIFIISKYDSILPILAGKYSAMPYIELPTNLVSTKEVKIASTAILKSKPSFLYVDSDIGRSLSGEIPVETDPVATQLRLYGEARARVMVLQGLNEVYARVADRYQRCQSGRLISVYCRKPD